MKPMMIILTILFLLLQCKLWLFRDGMWRVYQLKKHLVKQRQANFHLAQRNKLMEAEINDLKKGKIALEAHARTDLNMIKPGELFYRIIHEKKK
jgi:cell division protein FtsB